MDVTRAIHALQHADAVCFDVDSTVVKFEGIDILASHLGPAVSRTVRDLTASAMGGSCPFHVALLQRLCVLRHTKADIRACLDANPPADHLSPGVADVIQLLRSRGVAVYLVSGGFREMVEPVAVSVGLDPHEHVFANTLLYADAPTLDTTPIDVAGARTAPVVDPEAALRTGRCPGHEKVPASPTGLGRCVGFDPQEFTARDWGKPACLRHLRERHGFRTVVMVGDGATDLQTIAPRGGTPSPDPSQSPAADAFIGYGGVAQRPAVVAGADWFVRDFREVLARFGPETNTSAGPPSHPA
eukprot:TRINITY_DN70201_c0_g1_i1.p1 TRINITY_DN70201_c0_g1~~TRINITY_DN70201_c0_g1_i1.p1  ORF type:complete len:300 (-),score=35.74 TRINITY_DN70201_c0_g1_i1:88-987(-)